MPQFDSRELDLLSRAYHRALDALPEDIDDPEDAKAILLRKIVDAARRGERDENKLVEAAVNAIALAARQRPARMLHDLPAFAHRNASLRQRGDGR